MSKSLEELDPNFQTAKVENGLAWHRLSTAVVEGMGWPSESQAFTRLPDRAEGIVRDSVWQLSRHSAGIVARFFSDATQISARWSLRSERLAMDHMPATGVSGLDLYARDGDKWRWAGVGRATEFPTNEKLLIEKIDNSALSGEEREYLLYLPLYNGASAVEIGVPEGASLRFAPRDEKPICFYGTSIVHGGCASRPGMSYPAILGRRFNRPHYNLGFSGNAWSEKEVVDLLAELDPSVYVIDALPNMREPGIGERLEYLVRTLQAAHPSTPIVMVESVAYQEEWLSSARAEYMQLRNSILRDVWPKLESEFGEKLYYVECADLLGDDGEATVDGIHPTDVGFRYLAEAIEPALRHIFTAM